MPALYGRVDTARAMDLRALINLVPSIARKPLLELLGRLETLERQVRDLQTANKERS